MKLYCEKCALVHDFTPGDAERLVYALQGMKNHARQQPQETIEDPDDDFDCLQDVLRLSWDVEAFGEHVDSAVINRRFLKRGCGHVSEVAYPKMAKCLATAKAFTGEAVDFARQEQAFKDNLG